MDSPADSPAESTVRYPTKILRLLGLDRAVAFTLLGRLVAVLAGPVNLVFQLRFLSAEEQGYYASFLGLLGVTTFVELGVGATLGMFASHEMAVLAWGEDFELVGPPTAKARLRSLMRLGLAW